MSTLFDAFHFAEFQRELGVKPVAFMMRDAKQHTGAAIGRADPLKDGRGTGRAEHFADDVDIKQTFARPSQAWLARDRCRRP